MVQVALFVGYFAHFCTCWQFGGALGELLWYFRGPEADAAVLAARLRKRRRTALIAWAVALPFLLPALPGALEAYLAGADVSLWG